MYSTCLFCNGALGANTAIEVFPVGRRLAFDPAKGRLWVVCRGCERWNLSPLEERWEAIEECERRFRDTRLRTSTANIGLARLREGLELVRIGVPQRPEFAAWRYGDQFGRRRRNRIIRVGAATAAVGGVAVGIITAGIAAGASMGGAWWMLSRGADAAYRRLVNGNPKEIVAHVPIPDDQPKSLHAARRESGLRIPIQRRDLDQVGFVPAIRGASMAMGQWALRIPRQRADTHTLHCDSVTLHGEDAMRAAGTILPALNWGGAKPAEVTTATDFVEAAAGSSRRVFDMAASANSSSNLLRIDTPIRLALEMVAHEEAERRALEGELALLEIAWKEAEEIAAIADDMFLPKEIDDRIRKARSE